MPWNSVRGTVSPCCCAVLCSRHSTPDEFIRGLQPCPVGRLRIGYGGRPPKGCGPSRAALFAGTDNGKRVPPVERSWTTLLACAIAGHASGRTCHRRIGTDQSAGTAGHGTDQSAGTAGRGGGHRAPKVSTGTKTGGGQLRRTPGSRGQQYTQVVDNLWMTVSSAACSTARRTCHSGTASDGRRQRQRPGTRMRWGWRYGGRDD